MLSQPSPGEASTTLESQVQALAPSARLIHRLDRDTSGVVLIALDATIHTVMRDALAAGAVARRYIAVCDGVLDGARQIQLRIARHPHDQRRRVALPFAATGGRAAATRVRPIRRSTLAGRDTKLELAWKRAPSGSTKTADEATPTFIDLAQTGAPAFARTTLMPIARSSVLLPDMFEPVTTSAWPGPCRVTSFETRLSASMSG